MTDETVASLYTQSIAPDQVFIDKHDRNILRPLAEKLAKLAAQPIEQEKKDLWYRHNALEETRPMIFCDPENGWNEIVPKEQIKCRGKLAQQWEMLLRKEIFWGQSMGDDKVVEASFHVGYVYTESNWGMQEKNVRSAAHGSYRWEPPLKDYADLDKLHFPKITVDYESSDKLLKLAQSTFGNILMVQRQGIWWWTLGMTWTLIKLRGFTQFMMDMHDHPDELHQLMEILRDGHLDKLDFLEENGLLSMNNDNTYVGSGGFGFTNELPQQDRNGEHVRTIDMWGFCDSQETVSVSPEMFEEFIFPYQLPILKRFGLNCYGCCEGLDRRWHVIKRYPNLRRISVSAWANLEKMAEYLGADYILSYKPLPTDLAAKHIDEAKIRKYLRRALEITKHCRVEVIMKDNHTLGNNPQNVIDWCRIARQEVDRLK